MANEVSFVLFTESDSKKKVKIPRKISLPDTSVLSSNCEMALTFQEGALCFLSKIFPTLVSLLISFTDSSWL